MLSQFTLSHLLRRPQPLTPLPEYTADPAMRRMGLAGQRPGHRPAFPQEDLAPHSGVSGENGRILGGFASTPDYAMYSLFWGICQTPPRQPSGLLLERSMERGAPANPRNAPQSSVQGEEMRPMLDDTRVSDRMPHGLFVGRQREMATLRASLEEALAGRGGLVMLAGEPGIGKTRTAQQLAVQAAERGAQVLWGRCEEEAGAPLSGPGCRPYAPLCRPTTRRRFAPRWARARPTSPTSSLRCVSGAQTCRRPHASRIPRRPTSACSLPSGASCTRPRAGNPPC